MRKPNRTILFSAAAAVAISLTATAALASTDASPAAQPQPGTWSVSPFNTGLGAGLVGRMVIRDPSTGAKIKCAGSLDFSVTGGMGLTGTLATVGSQFVECTLSDGTSVSVTQGENEWNMTGVNFSSATNLGVTTGRFRNVDLSFSSTACSGNLDGTAASAGDGVLTYQHYNNPGYTIVRDWGGNLHAYDVSGCTGLFNPGDPVTVTATSNSGMTITSP